MQSFDLIVIGTGSAGKSAAESVRKAGKSVAIIDNMPFGGTCSQRGCDPKKVLVGAADVVSRSAQLTGKGITAKAAINWPDLMVFKKTFTESIPENTGESFRKLGIQAFHGTATFTSENTIRVGEDELQANQIVIATGHRPRPLGIPGEELVTDSTGFMELPQLPKNIVMIGGGYISMEFADVAARAGATVTILHRGNRLLENFDADLVNLLSEAMTETGVQILLEASVTAVEGEPGKLKVNYEKGNKTHTIETELVVHGAGRVANIEELNLEIAGVETDKKGVVVNKHLQSPSNSAVYACGDVTDRGLPLTPLAGYQGRIVAENILQNNSRTVSLFPVPSAVFTIPTLASVGMSEAEARQQNLNVEVSFQKTDTWYSSRRINESFSGFKTIVDKQSGQILGAHLLGDGSDELINLFTLAMKHKISAKDLTETLFAYPTHGSNISSMF